MMNNILKKLLNADEYERERIIGFYYHNSLARQHKVHFHIL